MDRPGGGGGAKTFVFHGDTHQKTPTREQAITNQAGKWFDWLKSTCLSHGPLSDQPWRWNNRTAWAQHEVLPAQAEPVMVSAEVQPDSTRKQSYPHPSTTP